MSGVLPSQRAVTAAPSVLSDGIRCRSELFLCSGTYGDTLSRCATRCCEGRIGRTWPRSCRWSRSAAAGTALCKALNRGQVRVARLRWALAALPVAGLGQRADPADG